jgi:hypothetical protein
MYFDTRNDATQMSCTILLCCSFGYLTLRSNRVGRAAPDGGLARFFVCFLSIFYPFFTVIQGLYG